MSREDESVVEAESPLHRTDPLAAGISALPETRQLDSRTLFAGQREITIRHHGALYRLRITQQNKLILTK